MGEKHGYLPFPKSFKTICIHHTKEPKRETCKETMAPIVTSNICRLESAGGPSQVIKGRLLNPTRSVLENLIAKLCKTKYALTYASGIGAIAAVFSLLKSGDHLLCNDDIYGGTSKTLIQVCPNFGICTSFVDLTDLKSIPEYIRPNTKLIWTENPTNPTLQVMDLCGLSKVAHQHKLMLAVDNTFLSPYLQRPAELGVDLVVNSVTKYMNGHSDVIMGVVCTSRDNLYERLKFIQQHFGHIPAPFDCYQVIRSLKTLPIRMMRHMSSGIKLAQYLENHPKIEKVLNPALPSHPQHDLFKSQACGHSGMLAVYLKGTNLDTTHKLIDSLKLFVHAVSLGGYESLVQMPTLLSHRDTPDKLKKISGITDNLIRVTTGLENIDDLTADWEQALDKI